MRKSRVTSPLLLIGDAGATHTRVLIVTAGREILGRGNAGPGNAYAVGNQLALQNLRRAVRMAIASAKVSPREIAAAVIGSASIESGSRASNLIESELRSSCPSARRKAVADSAIALEAALAGAPGVVITSGTGSVVLGKTARGKTLKIGGWGPLFGDEGSAQWIAREGLRLAAHANDKTGPPTSLTGIFTRHFQLPSFSRIIDVIYDHPTPAQLGALAPLVTQAAISGDPIARDIFSRGGEALGVQAAAGINRLSKGQGIVSYQGSMFSTGELLLNPLNAALHRYAPQARLVAPALPSIGGAYLLALGLIDERPSEEALATFSRHL